MLIALIIVLNAVRYRVGRNVPEVIIPALDSVAVVQVVDTLGARPATRKREYRNDTVRPNMAERRSRPQDRVNSVPETQRPTISDTVQPIPDRWVRKVRPTEPVDLNAADTSLLKTLPGIGSYFARRIVDYRESLGGYLRVEQILEIDVLSDTLVQWFMVQDTVPYRKIKVNSASVSEMRSHPYMNFYQARAISDLRKSIGLIRNPARLTLLEEFTGQDMERLIPYLDFN